MLHIMQIRKRASDSINVRFKHHDRLIKKDGFWYFQTREGLDVGPFTVRHEAQYALLYFAEKSSWPSATQLVEFIEGCKLLNGLKN